MKTRILRIIARMNVGGPAIHATLLSRGLDPERYESHLVSGTEAPDEGNYLEMHDVRLDRLHPVPALGRELHPWRDQHALSEIRRIIREVRPHIVHTHTAKAGVLGRWAAWRERVPVIVHTFHGHVFNGYFSSAKTAAFVQIERALARVTTRLVTVSDDVRAEILGRGIGRADRFEVIRLGLDLDRFAEAEKLRGQLKQQLGLAPDVPTVGIVARLVPIKAHEVFLDVAGLVAAKRRDTVFLIVGDGERRGELEASVRARGLQDRVRFLGWRADLDSVYADLDVVMLTSRNEGSPVALIEAMAAARPVVATCVGGVAELVGDAGLVADVDDSPALARHVLTLLDDEAQRDEIGRRGRSRVIPWYSHSRLLSDIDSLYQRLIRESGGLRP